MNRELTQVEKEDQELVEKVISCVTRYNNGNEMTGIQQASIGLLFSEILDPQYEEMSKLKSKNEKLTESLENLMGVLDTPIGRRKMDDDFTKEALLIARELIKK